MEIRRNTAAGWTAANTILAIGEVGVETDTQQFKFGDSVTAWNALAYGKSGGSGGAVASGQYASAEGFNTTASGASAHAEGEGTVASGSTAHAEGNYTTASGDYSHAEGSGSIASGIFAHAEGNYCNAVGEASYAGGTLATATHDGTFVRSDAENADFDSTLANQASFRFANGYRFMGGSAAFPGTPNYADDAAADADTALISGSFYTTTAGGRAVYKKP